MSPARGGCDRPPLSRADPGRLRRDVEWLTRETVPRTADHPEILDRAAAYVRRELESAGARVREQTYAARGRSYRNVIGTIGPGAGAWMVVGAHYDACGTNGPNPGADDNASGTAGLLELARGLAGGELPVRVELVAYSTEEPPFFGTGQMGSAVHARSLDPSDLPEAMLCLEMIGYYSARQPWPEGLEDPADPGHGEFVAITGRPADRALVERVDAAFRRLGAIESIAYAGPYLEALGLSDHRNYWEIGVPAVMVGDTAFLRNPHYHRPTDTAETLDYERMAAVVEGVMECVRSWRGLASP